MFLHALYVFCLFSRKDILLKLKALLKVKYLSKSGGYSQECLEGNSGSKVAKVTQQFALVCPPDQRRKPDPSFLTSVLFLIARPLTDGPPTLLASHNAVEY